MGLENEHYVKELKKCIREPIFRNYQLEGKEKREEMSKASNEDRYY